MGKHRKTWSKDEKLQVVNFYNEHGVAKTVKEFSISSTSIFKWKSDLDSNESNIRDKTSDKDRIILQLKRENQAYKELVAEKELAIRIQEALLKKKF